MELITKKEANKYKILTAHCLRGFCVGLFFGMHYFVSFLALQ